MKKFFLALLLAASAACMAAQVAFADDSGFIAGGGSAGSGSGVGRDDIATSETASGVGRDDVLAFGSDMKDSVDKYGGGLGEGIDYAKEMLRDVTMNVVQCKKVWRFQFNSYYDGFQLENAQDPTLVRPLRRACWFVTDADYNA